ncbi:MAG TPA: type 1 glutamine amidotransferase domain-containing protein [Gemmatimonadaceae bacterium]|nr:type 1 glutamine amidotransferase domain-containing protein [Gemmatimonadaceae bacterium]
MSRPLEGKRIAILATDGVEQVELVDVRKALDDAGAKTDLVSPKTGSVQAVRHKEKGDTFPVDVKLSDAKLTDYSALYLPGGVASPDALRMDKQAVQFVREFMAADKPVAAICHGAWLLVEADAVAGRKLTSWPGLKTDIVNAGGEWVDEAVTVDGGLITSRKPEDIPVFTRHLLAEFSTQITERAVDRMSEQSFPASDPPPGPASIGGTGASTTEARP